MHLCFHEIDHQLFHISSACKLSFKALVLYCSNTGPIQLFHSLHKCEITDDRTPRVFNLCFFFRFCLISSFEILNCQYGVLLAHPETVSYSQVEESMKNIDLVVREREIALRLLQTGHEKPVPGEWRHDFLGRTYWYEKENLFF